MTKQEKIKERSLWRGEIKPTDINSNAKIRRYEKRLSFLKLKEPNEWTLNEIDKLNDLI